jgi:restriction system protein
VAVIYDSRPKSVLIDRLEWARSYAKQGGALDSPSRGLFVLSTFGKDILALPEPEATEAIKVMDRQVRSNRVRTREGADDEAPPTDEEIEAEDTGWTGVLLARLHRLTPEGFEEFVMYLLRTYGLELTRVGGTGDQGIDGIGIAPLSPVLSSRVAVQAKRYDPTSTEPVKRRETPRHADLMSASGDGSLIQATVGSFGGVGRRWRKRAGLAA